MIRLVVAGAAGRMGQAILRLAAQDTEFEIVGGLEKAGHPSLGKSIGESFNLGEIDARLESDPVKILKEADVMIDFTHASVVSGNLKAALDSGTAYVLGTTGLDKETLAKLNEASSKIGIVQSPNMSVGVNLLFKLTEIASTVLNESYDAEISEAHHRAKKDAPSGTAMKLLEVIAKARKKDSEKDAVFGRKGDIGARESGQIGVMALRGGDVVGDHTVFYYGDGERVELTHRASSRDAFASGSLVAAKFIAKQKTGLFDMGQVLGID